jgi:hypothetical protein
MPDPIRLELDGITYRVFDATMLGDYRPTNATGAIDQDPR